MNNRQNTEGVKEGGKRQPASEPCRLLKRLPLIKVLASPYGIISCWRARVKKGQIDIMAHSFSPMYKKTVEHSSKGPEKDLLTTLAGHINFSLERKTSTTKSDNQDSSFPYLLCIGQTAILTSSTEFSEGFIKGYSDYHITAQRQIFTERDISKIMMSIIDVQKSSTYQSGFITGCITALLKPTPEATQHELFKISESDNKQHD